MSRLLIAENPLMVLPTLVELVGLERAIILQQIHFLLSLPRGGKEVDGFKWVWNTAQEWHDEHFRFWAVDSVRKWLASLEKDKILISARFDSANFNQRKYYRIDYDKLEELLDGKNANTDAAPNATSTIGSNSRNNAAPNAESCVSQTSNHNGNGNALRLHTETTNRESAAKPAAIFSHLSEPEQEFAPEPEPPKTQYPAKGEYLQRVAAAAAAYQAKASSYQTIYEKHFPLNVNWRAKANQEVLEWLAAKRATNEQFTRFEAYWQQKNEWKCKQGGVIDPPKPVQVREFWDVAMKWNPVAQKQATGEQWIPASDFA